MPRRAKRIRHEDGFAKGQEESLSNASPMQEAAEAPLLESAHPDADTHLLQNLRHPTAHALRLQAMQRLTRFGNQAYLQRQPHDAGMDATQQADMDAFLAKGVLPDAQGQGIIGSKGNGGFTARWDPNERALIVTLKIGFKFTAGLVVDNSGAVTANEADLDKTDDADAIAKLQTQATNITGAFPNAADRQNEVNSNWTWAGGEKDPYIQQYQAQIVNAWGGQYAFQAKRFPDLMANVRLELDVHEGHQADDHCRASIIKSPVDLQVGGVTSGQWGNPNDQRMVLDSGDVNPDAHNFLREAIYFEHNSADLAKAKGSTGRAATDVLDDFVKEFQAATDTGGPPISLTGRASSSGTDDYNIRLSKKRSAAVEEYIRNKGLRGDVKRLTSEGKGEEGASDTAEWRRVDIQVGNGEAQTTSIHEFGHLLGLGDEYPLGTSVTGDPADHDKLAKEMGGGVTGALVENNDNIMSAGTVVRPQHYATFHMALETVTGEKWELAGQGRGVPTRAPDIGGPNANPNGTPT